MRNLTLLKSIKAESPGTLSSETVLCVDCDTGTVYVATEDEVVAIEPQMQQVINSISLVGEGYIQQGAIPKQCVIGLQYLPDQMALCIATSKGDVLLWNTTTMEVECVGCVDHGLRSMSWSPDQEIMLLATGQDTLIMMTRDFDPVTEVPIAADDFGEAEFVTVGWGKKETQFHGSEGKSAATKKKEGVKPVFDWDDHCPQISWRGDGQYFVVSHVEPSTGSRRLRVWTRECVLHSTSEDVDGLEQALAWKPSGSLIASSQRRPNKHDIVFFERNGLRHGEFTLPFKNDEVLVHELSWNTESTVITVWCEDMKEDEQGKKSSYVQLWTVGNYHWYLKQNLKFENKVVSVVWDPEHAYVLHVLTDNGQYLQYTWSWATDCSSGSTSDDQALVAVIDGANVLMTPFRGMVVPPPMCAYKLQQTCPVNQVIFAPPPHSNSILLVLSDDTLVIYKFEKNGLSKPDPTLKLDGAGGGGHFHVKCDTPCCSGVYRLQYEDSTPMMYPLWLYHVTWVSMTTVLFVTVSPGSNTSVLCQAEINETEKTMAVRHTCDLEGSVIGICLNPETSHIAIQLENGTLLRYDTASATVLPWEGPGGHEVAFPQPCSQMRICSIGGEEAVLGLTERFRFYVNDVEVASNCTSFAVHEEFILLTTHTHTCRCICRKTKIKDLPSLSDGKAHPFDESVRRVERGSKIVTVVTDDTKVVLQMPRGNLETIYPRALVLSAVRKCLDGLKYKEAFTIMKKHRINMNLIHDHNPSLFLDNIQTFIKQVEVINHLNLFLTDLVQEDVTVTMYTAAYNREPVPDDREMKSSKIDTVCDAVRETMEKLDPDKYLLSILTAHARKSTPELDLALQRVKTLKGSLKQHSVSAEDALKYLTFLVDVNELYDVALGTYDFDLVIMVAEKSQKDPKEYLPFLNHLRSLEANYQMYSIDKYLKRHEKALNSISKCGKEKFPECLSLVKEHKLYPQALELFATESQEYKEIAVAYGEYLTSEKLHEEAGIVYTKAEEYELALSSYERAHNWRQTLITALKMNYSPEQLTGLAMRLADYLKNHRGHLEAAYILEHYASDVEEAIVTLIEGCAWEGALELMYRHRRTDFIESNLKSAVMENYELQLGVIEEHRDTLLRHKNRLVVVREEKERKRLEILEGEGYNDADADLFSDTSSATGASFQSSRYTADSQRSSTYSKSTGKSAKNRRKHEGKKWSLREGGRHEDLALIHALSKLVKQIEEMRNDINSLLKMLVLFSHLKEADKLQSDYESLLQIVEKGIPVIWNEEDLLAGTNQMTTGPGMSTNAIVMAMQQGAGRAVNKEPTLDASLRVPPSFDKDKKWKLSLLKKA